MAGFSVPASPASSATFTDEERQRDRSGNFELGSHHKFSVESIRSGIPVVIYATAAGIMNADPTDGQAMGDNLSISILPVSVTMGRVDARFCTLGRPAKWPGLLTPEKLREFPPEGESNESGQRFTGALDFYGIHLIHWGAYT